MGDIQTYFYLALISVIMIGLTLTFWLVGSAITLALLFIVFGTAGVLYGFIRYGAS